MPSIPTNPPCSHLGCKAPKSYGTAYCVQHGGKQSDKQQQNAKLYNTNAWRKRRAAVLSTHPLCAACLLDGVVTAALHVDHVIPHRQSYDRFMTNVYQGLCHAHHTIKTNLEKQGVYRHYTDKKVIDYSENEALGVVMANAEEGRSA